jgi:hypothetical protein
MIAAEGIATRYQSPGDRLRQAFAWFCEIDYTQPITFAILSVWFVASRLPFIDHGYGTDPDAWRVALTAQYFRDTGDYYPSRLPGYPLHEFITAGIGAIHDSWVWTNLSTVAVSLAGVYIFAELAKKLELPNRGILTIGFAFAPLLWINSAMTMDYMWALTFLMGAYLSLLYGQTQLGGFSLGLAAACRLTSLYMMPVFWIYLLRTKKRGEIRHFTFTALAVTLAAYTLVLMTYGLNFLNFFDQKVYIEEFVKRLGKDGLGILGATVLVAALVVSWERLRSFPRDLRADPNVLLWTLAIGLYFFSYMRLPHEIAYLLPLFPFGFFLMARYMSRAVLSIAIAAIVLAGFVDITSSDDTTGLSVSTFTSASLGKGMLFSDIETMDNQRDFAQEVRELTSTNDEVIKPAVVMTGFIYPELAVLYEDELEAGIIKKDITAISQLSDMGRACDPSCDGEPRIQYVWLIDFDTFMQYRSEGMNVYVTPDAERSTFAVYHYRPTLYGAVMLPLSRDNPSVGKGTASTDR